MMSGRNPGFPLASCSGSALVPGDGQNRPTLAAPARYVVGAAPGQTQANARARANQSMPQATATVIRPGSSSAQPQRASPKLFQGTVQDAASSFSFAVGQSSTSAVATLPSRMQPGTSIPQVQVGPPRNAFPPSYAPTMTEQLRLAKLRQQLHPHTQAFGKSPLAEQGGRVVRADFGAPTAVASSLGRPPTQPPTSQAACFQQFDHPQSMMNSTISYSQAPGYGPPQIAGHPASYPLHNELLSRVSPLSASIPAAARAAQDAKYGTVQNDVTPQMMMIANSQTAPQSMESQSPPQAEDVLRSPPQLPQEAPTHHDAGDHVRSTTEQAALQQASPRAVADQSRQAKIVCLDPDEDLIAFSQFCGMHLDDMKACFGGHELQNTWTDEEEFTRIVAGLGFQKDARTVFKFLVQDFVRATSVDGERKTGEPDPGEGRMGGMGGIGGMDMASTMGGMGGMGGMDTSMSSCEYSFEEQESLSSRGSVILDSDGVLRKLEQGAALWKLSRPSSTSTEVDEELSELMSVLSVSGASDESEGTRVEGFAWRGCVFLLVTVFVQGISDSTTRSTEDHRQDPVGSMNKEEFADITEEAAESIMVATFTPGNIGITANWTTGEVIEIPIMGQGDRHGVKVGMILHEIDGKPFSEALLDSKIAGKEDYEISFKKEKATEDQPLLKPVAAPQEDAHADLADLPSGSGLQRSSTSNQGRQSWVEAQRGYLQKMLPVWSIELVLDHRHAVQELESQKPISIKVNGKNVDLVQWDGENQAATWARANETSQQDRPGPIDNTALMDASEEGKLIVTEEVDRLPTGFLLAALAQLQAVVDKTEEVSAESSQVLERRVIPFASPASTRKSEHPSTDSSTKEARDSTVKKLKPIEEWITIQYSDRYGDEIRQELGMDVQDEDVLVKTAIGGEQVMSLTRLKAAQTGWSDDELKQRFPINVKKEWITIQYSDRYGDEIGKELGLFQDKDVLVKTAIADCDEGDEIMSLLELKAWQTRWSDEEFKVRFPIKVKKDELRRPVEPSRLFEAAELDIEEDSLGHLPETDETQVLGSQHRARSPEGAGMEGVTTEVAPPTIGSSEVTPMVVETTTAETPSTDGTTQAENLSFLEKKAIVAMRMPEKARG